MNEDTAEKAMELIMEACELMGWGVVMTPDEHNDAVHFLIIGTEEGLEMASRRLNGDLQ